LGWNRDWKFEGFEVRRKAGNCGKLVLVKVEESEGKSAPEKR
jgi:hypothetical protein